jgi:hypothetical protein
MRQKGFLSLIVVSLIFIFSSSARAKQISVYEAQTALDNWLSKKELHMGELLGNVIFDIKLYAGARSGNIGYYLAILDKGWVVLPADDRFWPIQTFGSGEMTHEIFESSMWHDVLRYDYHSFDTMRRGGFIELLFINPGGRLFARLTPPDCRERSLCYNPT